MKVSIAIVDDNNFLIKSVREKLSFFDDIVVLFTSNNGMECLEKLAHYKTPDIILMDIEMPIKNGIETAFAVKEKYPQIKIIMLTVFDDDENIFNAIKSGADGYLLKETSPQLLYDAIIQTLAGGAIMTPSIAIKALNLLRNPISFQSNVKEDKLILTARETEVLEQLSKGLPYTAIAENLFISPSTVRRHIENIYTKLQVHSKIEAVALAKKRNLI